MGPIKYLKTRIRDYLRVVADESGEATATSLGARLGAEGLEHFRQIEGLIGLYGTLDIAVPLPPTRAWVASPDFLAELVRLIATHRPVRVLELGSGVSTIVVAYALERFSGGTVMTVEHEPEHAERARRMAEVHGLSERVQVIECPLITASDLGAGLSWYDISELEAAPGSIDLLIVDGPPAYPPENWLNRYPALPRLRHLLSPNALVVMDDTVRDGEKEAIRRWDAMFGPLEIESPVCEKGMAVISLPH